ncbi:cystathionine beta-lyase [Mesorhizobium sp. M3A.F.Ca.ET.174.01.1.1]|uniref:cystathionine beta-lyase n=1 Tax=unclassified Mesorhizobium TaxID=325217 RepID=UPI0010937069|nr:MULTISPECIES: cystathionine beta-lyase [unclassified Mesorhizobium]TGS87426.1 cystathionine beta-lyase [Mesorhizobium sp. M3A.F.Ca.ET.175.01.1.1]TGT27886.1 cystathionine beta-lyase [Mesorhizobium sp. M3A.F.Ca.ET.174.01.1.1]
MPIHSKRDTVLVHAGRHPEDFGGAVNTPVVRASTILYPDLKTYERSRADKFSALRYGRYGTQTAFALAEAMAQCEQGDGSVLYPSGLAAIACVLKSLLGPGDHLLVTDAVYGPARNFCETELRRNGVDVTFFPPTTGAGISDLIRPQTRVVYCESPGSLSFEVQDIPAIAAACAASDIAVVVDNTWATPFFHQPLKLGAHISIHAATKYIVGHSDAMLGVAVARERHLPRLRAWAAEHGILAGPDECWLGLRGLRSLGARLRQHQESAKQVAEAVQDHPAVKRVLYPALPTDDSHTIWLRDFAGATGLFGIELMPAASEAVRDLIDGLKLFGIGSSWGGYESLVLPSNPIRTVSHAHWRGPLLRLHIGLEDPNDLLEDLQSGLDALHAANLRHERKQDARNR